MKRKLTRFSAYDNSDPTQNELIGMEEYYVATQSLASSESTTDNRTLSKENQMKKWIDECQKCKLPPPVPYDKIERIDWKHVTTFDRSLLKPNQKFKSLEELAEIPRRHPKFPFCRPGPVQDSVTMSQDWYYADSIIQKIEIVGTKIPHYVVRWIGYEDV